MDKMNENNNNKNFVTVNLNDLKSNYNPALDPAYSLRNIHPNVKNPNVKQPIDLKKEVDKLINFENAQNKK
jgi:hypothetical protein